LSQSSGDKGYFGAGIYFSEYSNISIGYISRGSKLLLSKLLVGRQFRCNNIQTGRQLEPSYDSHTSPDERSEIVIFDVDQILPCYIVHFG